MMNWQITFSILLVAFLTSGLFYLINPEIYPDPWFTLTTGGLMLGAVFMATDMVASPVTPLGVWIYGADEPFEGDRIYQPKRYPHYNASNYRAEISLPGWG